MSGLYKIAKSNKEHWAFSGFFFSRLTLFFHLYKKEKKNISTGGTNIFGHFLNHQMVWKGGVVVEVFPPGTTTPVDAYIIRLTPVDQRVTHDVGTGRARLPDGATVHDFSSLIYHFINPFHVLFLFFAKPLRLHNNHWVCFRFAFFLDRLLG